MVKVEAIESNNNRRGHLVPLLNSAGTGALVGFTLKYIQPVTLDEKNTHEYKQVIKDINTRRTTYSSWTENYLNKIRGKSNLSLAEDVFIKTFDGLKEGEHVGTKRIRQAFASVKTEDKGELKQLFENARYQAERVAKRYIKLNDLLTKHIRPTGFFLISGAVTGAFISLIHSILRTDVKNS